MIRRREFNVAGLLIQFTFHTRELIFLFGFYKAPKSEGGFIIFEAGIPLFNLRIESDGY